MLHHPCILGGPRQREQNQNSKPTPGGHPDAPRNEAWIQRLSRFLNSTGQNWPTCGQTGYVTPVVSGIPTAIELGGRIVIGPLVGKVAT